MDYIKPELLTTAKIKCETLCFNSSKSKIKGDKKITPVQPDKGCV